MQTHTHGNSTTLEYRPPLSKINDIIVMDLEPGNIRNMSVFKNLVLLLMMCTPFIGHAQYSTLLSWGYLKRDSFHVKNHMDNLYWVVKKPDPKVFTHDEIGELPVLLITTLYEVDVEARRLKMLQVEKTYVDGYVMRRHSDSKWFYVSPGSDYEKIVRIISELRECTYMEGM